MKLNSSLTRTPCIGVCSTTSVGDSICRGCKRYAFEVIRWNGYLAPEKEAVLRRIEALTVQIMQDKFHIVSVESLQQGMAQLKLPFNAALSPYCWLNTLFQKAQLERVVLADLGVSVSPELAHLSSKDLATLVDGELLLLCDAHFERYFKLVDGLS